MKILFSSDLHGDKEAYIKFAQELTSYDCGVLAGDLMDEFITKKEAEDMGLIDIDEPEELLGADEDEFDKFDNAYNSALHDPTSTNRKGLEKKKIEIVDVLNSANKPIFYITGNHDIADWQDHKNLYNIENKKVSFGGVSFVGFSPTNLRFSEIQQNDMLSKLTPLVDGNTILVSHSPPYGILDKNTKNENIGSRALYNFINKTNPVFCLFGHVHENFGIYKNFINGSWQLNNRFIAVDTKSKNIKIINPDNIINKLKREII